jgi:hypothetical protein
MRETRANIRIIKNCAFRNSRIFPQKRAPAGGYSCLECPVVHHTCPTPHGVWGSGCLLGGGGLPRGTSPRPHGALRTRFARIRRTFGGRFAPIRDATTDTYGTNTTIKSLSKPPHNNPPTHGSRWGKPPAPLAFTHVPRRVARGPQIFACRGDPTAHLMNHEPFTAVEVSFIWFRNRFATL